MREEVVHYEDYKRRFEKPPEGWLSPETLDLFADRLEGLGIQAVRCVVIAMRRTADFARSERLLRPTSR